MTATSCSSLADACIQRIDQGEGPQITLADAIEAVSHPLKDRSRSELVEVAAYLACQVVGYRHRQSADAALAMSQVRTIVRDYDRRHGQA